MRQNIPVQKLAPGMKIVALDIGWDKSPKWQSPFVLSSGEDLALLLEHCRVVSVETGAATEAPIPRPATTTAPAAKAPPVTPAAATSSSATLQEDTRLPSGMSCARAAACYRQSLDVLTRNFERLSWGDGLDSAALKQTADELTEACSEQPQTLLLMTELQERTASLAQKSLNIAILSISFGRSLGLSGERLKQLALAAMLHDIGMLKLPKTLLQKKGKADAADRIQLQKHIRIGCDLLYGYPELRPLIKTIAHHHERFDGKGYPTGIAGERIPLEARLLAVTGIYHTLLNQPGSADHARSTQALRKLYALRDRHLDPKLTVRFIRYLGIYPIGTLVELNDRKLALVVDVHQESRTRPVVQCLQNIDGVSLAADACAAEPLDLAQEAFRHLNVVRSVPRHQAQGLDLTQILSQLGLAA